MDWQELRERIQGEIRPNHSAILTCNGRDRRPVTSNNSLKIGMRTGAKQSKAITYEMIRFAFNTLAQTGRYDSHDFRNRFADEYAAAPCRFSMTGGVLVELGLAELVPGESEVSCHYKRKR